MSTTNADWDLSVENRLVPPFIPTETYCGTLDLERAWYEVTPMSSHDPNLGVLLAQFSGENSPLVPLTRESGIFQIIGLADQPES